MFGFFLWWIVGLQEWPGGAVLVGLVLCSNFDLFVLGGVCVFVRVLGGVCVFVRVFVYILHRRQLFFLDLGWC